MLCNDVIYTYDVHTNTNLNNTCTCERVHVYAEIECALSDWCFFRIQQYGANVTSQHTSGAYLSGGGGGVSSSPIYIPPSAPAQHGQQQHHQSAAAGAAGTGMVHNTSVPANLNTYSQVGKATAAQHS